MAISQLQSVLLILQLCLIKKLKRLSYIMLYIIYYFYFKGCLKQLYMHNKVECFSYKSGCDAHKCIVAAGLSYK